MRNRSTAVNVLLAATRAAVLFSVYQAGYLPGISGAVGEQDCTLQSTVSDTQFQAKGVNGRCTDVPARQLGHWTLTSHTAAPGTPRLKTGKPMAIVCTLTRAGVDSEITVLDTSRDGEGQKICARAERDDWRPS